MLHSPVKDRSHLLYYSIHSCNPSACITHSEPFKRTSISNPRTVKTRIHSAPPPFQTPIHQTPKTHQASPIFPRLSKSPLLLYKRSANYPLALSRTGHRGRAKMRRRRRGCRAGVYHRCFDRSGSCVVGKATLCMGWNGQRVGLEHTPLRRWEESH